MAANRNVVTRNEIKNTARYNTDSEAGSTIDWVGNRRVRSPGEAGTAMQFEQLEASNTRQHRGWVGGAGSRPARDSQSRRDSSVNGAVVKCRAYRHARGTYSLFYASYPIRLDNTLTPPLTTC